MKTEKDLVTETLNFLRIYWKEDLNGEAPLWSDPWDFNNTIPNNDKKGCYALFNDNNEVIYIGVAIGKNFGEYKKSTGAYFGGGLGARLKAYWKKNKEPGGLQYEPATNWPELKTLRTIGFNDDHYWLCAALEIFLIEKLTPPRNSKHKNKGKVEQKIKE